MGTNSLNGKLVAILATDGFEEAELIEPRRALEKAGAKVAVISFKKGKIQGMKHDEKGKKAPVDVTLEKANPDDFDALLLPGGALNADALRVELKAQEFARHTDEAGKPIAVICHGPWLLVSAGLTRGRTMTSYHTIRDDIRNAGAKWKDEQIVHDANWVSSRQPRDLPVFNKAMIRLFAGNANDKNN